MTAQRKELSQARSYMKTAKKQDKTDKRIENYRNAENLMTDLLKDSTNRNNPKIYLLLYESVKKQYETGNEQLYLKQKYDTVAIFNLTKRMFAIVETLDSIDAAPDRNGRAEPEYRRRHAAELNAYRPNLYNGGTYNIHKADYKTAYSFFETYIDCGRQPLFTGYNYNDKDSRMPGAAYWATYCGYKLKDAELTLKYSDIAKRDTALYQFTLLYMAEAYKQKKDDGSYMKTLYEGFKHYPEFPYFFPHIIDYYTEKNQLDSALAVANEAIKVNAKSKLFLFAKSTILLNMGQYDECIAVSDSLIQLNDSLADPHFNVGTAYLNQALVLEGKTNPRQYRFQIRKLYQQARPYMERYRELAPTEKQKWGPSLYRIYLNLNMGKQFEEIDTILKEK